MLFNSIDFVIFFPVVFVLYWVCSTNLRLRNSFILVSSYVFYGWWDWTFIFKLNDDIETRVLEKYKLGLYLYAYDDKNLLSDKGRNHESANFSPTVVQVNGNRYIVKKIRTALTRFSKIRFFLFDRSGYSGIIGNAIEIENIQAHQKLN